MAQTSLVTTASKAAGRPYRKAGTPTFGTQRITQECPAIENTRITTIVACSGQFVNGLEVKTSAPHPPFLIDYIRFDSVQKDPYTGKNGEHLVLAYPWNAQAGLVDITFPLNTGATDRIHYVYACLKPVPADPACRPFALITVTVKPTPPKCVPLVLQRTRVGLGPR